MYVPNFRRCPLTSKLTGFVLNISKFCTIFHLALTQLVCFYFLLNQITQGHFSLFTHLFNIINIYIYIYNNIQALSLLLFLSPPLLYTSIVYHH
ncbi:hypothetical protein Hanom_Chr06g00560251 [Helianthus anomalus]